MTQDDRKNTRKNDPKLSQLEPRLMFDGAVVETSLEIFSDELSDFDIPNVDDSSLFVIAVANADASAAAGQAQKQIKDFLGHASVEELFEIFNGGREKIDAEWLQSVESTRQSILSGEVSIAVEILANTTMGGKLGAYSSEGLNGEPVIFLNQSYLEALGTDVAAKVLVEELGHALDDMINDGVDSAGDEGQLFADWVQGISDSASTAGAHADNDHGELIIGGEKIAVEFAQFSFVNAYEMVYDLNNNSTYNDANINENYDAGEAITGGKDNTERWAEKEQNLHYFNTAALVNVDAGEKITIDDNNYDSSYFSGNDVSAIGIDIAGNTYYGWLSRPIKSQGVVRGFYFWTDSRFVDLTTAQADGNQDGDSNALNNQGFLLVVDQSWFDSQIASASSYDINNYKDGNLGTIGVATVGSSSDRVDSALNELIDQNANPVAIADASDLTIAVGGSGGPALELGSDDNDPTRTGYYETLNTLTTDGNLTDTVDATGNVLVTSGGDVADTDSDGDDLLITAVSSDSTKDSSDVDVLNDGVVTGSYGTLTIKNDGSYTYSIDNTNVEVDALLPTDKALSDVFTYTVSDGRGGFATTTLSIRIKGSNDAPVAYHDLNFAKETDTTLGITGFDGTGNVLTNDTDVDSNDQLAVDFGTSDLAVTLNVADFTSTSPTSNLTFEGDLASSIGSGKYIGVVIGGVQYGLFNGSGSSTPVRVDTRIDFDDTNGDGLDEYKLTLDSSTLYYGAVDGSGTTAWTLGGNQQYVFAVTASKLSSTDPKFVSYATTSSAANSGIETIDLTGASYVKGDIVVGMTVSGAGWPVGAYVSQVDLDGSNNITSIQVTVTSNIDRTTYPTTIDANFTLESQTYVGAYGQLQISADGSYTYTPFKNIDKYYDANSISDVKGNISTYSGALFASGAVDTDTFTYTVADLSGAKSKADLTITVYGSGSNDPSATSGTASVDEQGYTNLSVSSNPDRGYITTNDHITTGSVSISNTQNPKLNLTSQGTPFVVGNEFGVTGSSSLAITSDFGSLTLNDNGSFSYELNNSNATVNALQLGETLTDTFYYSVTNYDDASYTTQVGIVVNSITITINGSNDDPVAYDNQSGLAEDSGLRAQGNVLLDKGIDTNYSGAEGEALDSDIDNRDSFTVTNVSNTTTSATSAVVGSTQIAGEWGFLTIDTDGSYTYRHYVSSDGGYTTQASTIQAMTTGDSETDTFIYTITDSKGRTSAAELIITLDGSNEPPVNLFNGNPITSTNSPVVEYPASGSLAFTGTNEITISDDDTNLTEVVLHVDNGTIEINSAYTLPAGVTVTSSDDGKTLTITSTSGTAQADINNTVAKLEYTFSPDVNAVSSDYLTITSFDSEGAYDSDSIAITIPTTLTVYESGLSTGRDAASDTESVSILIDAPLGRKVTDVTTPQNITDSGRTIGTFTIVNGELTFTLAANVDHRSVTQETFTYTTTDLDGGNPQTHTVTVNIVDDTPVSSADTNTVGDNGKIISGNVLGDGTPDIFGADDAATTTPSGGVIGVRAANGDTTSPVNTGTSSSIAIAGQYGSLILDSDGSYTYTSGYNATATNLDDVFVYTIEDSDGSRSTNTLTITIEPTPVDLSMAKTATFDTATGKVTYQLEVVNTESAVASSGFTVTDTLPSGLSVLTYSTNGTDFSATLPTGVTLVGGVLTWDGGALAANTATSLYVRATADAGTTTLANTAKVDGDDFDDDTSNDNSTASPAISDLKIEKSVNDQTPNLNGEVIYKLEVTNDGPDAANNVRVIDNLPASLLFVGASLDGLNYDKNGLLSGYVTSTDTWTIGELESGDTATLYIKVKVLSLDAVNNVASVISDTYDSNIADNIDDGSTDLGGNNQRVKAVAPPPPPRNDSAPAPSVTPPAPIKPVESIIPAVNPIPDEVVATSPQVELIVQRDIPLQEFTSDGLSSISYTIPADTFGFVGEAGSSASIELSAIMADGQALPDWLIFDPKKGEFRGTPPQGYDGTLQMRVIAQDDSGNIVETMVTIQVKAGLDSQAFLGGKPGVLDQFKSQSHFAWKVERDRLLEIARKLRA